MRSKQPTIEDIYMADYFITAPGVRDGLLERASAGDDDEVVTQDTDDGPVVYYRTAYGEMMPVGRPVMLAAGPSETVTDAGPAVRTGRGGVPLRPPSMRDITEPAKGMADMFAATGKGLVQGFVGLPGDLEALTYGIKEIFNRGAGEGKLDAFLRGFQSGTVLPRTDEVKKWLDQNVGQVGAGTSPYETMGEVVAPGGQVRAVQATGRAAAAGARALAPKAGEMLNDYVRRSGMQLDLIGYHGSPQYFEKFSAKKIGSGEGAQAYGYGLYFAESRNVANSYRIRLSYDPSKMRVGGRQINDVYTSIEQNAVRMSPSKAQAEYEKLDVLERLMMNQMPSELVNHVNNLSPATKSWFAKTIVPSFQTYGTMYTVDIPDGMVAKMLDFDAPLGQQSPEIQALAQKYKLAMDDLGGDLLAAAEGKTANGAKTMREAGIPGVRYLDQGSRGDGKGTRNIVVFPGGESQIKIIETEGAK